MHVTLFGRFSFSKQDHGLGFEELHDSHKLQELLAYLLMHADYPLTRDEIAGAVWNEHSAPQANAHALKALNRLKTILEQENLPLLYDTSRVQWNQAIDLQVDVHQFEAIFAEASTDTSEPVRYPSLVRFFAGADLYRGPFLDGFYSSWCTEIRNHLEQKFLHFLDLLMAACETLGEYDFGINYGIRAIRLEPAREVTHQRLMRLLYLMGDRTSALRQYQRCTDALVENLSMPPGRETVALYRQLQDGGTLPLSPQGTLPSSLHKTLTNLHNLDVAASQLQALQLQPASSIQQAMEL